MVKDLTVLDNMLMPYPPLNAFGQIRRREARRQVDAHLGALGLSNIDPQGGAAATSTSTNARRSKSPGPCFVVRRSCCWTSRPPPCRVATSTGSATLSQQCSADGVTIVFISHRMREVRAFCDRVTVLRNGKAHRDRATGRRKRRGDDRHDRRQGAREVLSGEAAGAVLSGDPVLGVRPLATDSRLEDVSLRPAPRRDPRGRRPAGHGPA